MVMECWVTVSFTAAVNSLTLSFASGSISNASFLLYDSRSLWVLYLCIIWMKPCWSCTEITVWKIYILIFCCYCFKINFFVRLTLFFLWGWLHRNIIFNLGEMNFSVSSPRPTEKKNVFFCAFIFFSVWINTQKK